MQELRKVVSIRVSPLPCAQRHGGRNQGWLSPGKLAGPGRGTLETIFIPTPKQRAHLLPLAPGRASPQLTPAADRARAAEATRQAPEGRRMLSDMKEEPDP